MPERLKTEIAAVDIFCGVGGLTKGLCQAGIKVVAGIDFDQDCEFPFTENNQAQFHCQDVAKVDPKFVAALFPKTGFRVLSGCAPCQPFSRYGRTATKRRSKWSLLSDFARIAEEVRPDVITIENVPELTLHPVFKELLSRLTDVGYDLAYDTLFCPQYGVPQRRKRLVLLASLHGEIALPLPTYTSFRFPTVRNVLENLPRLEAGQVDDADHLHRSSNLSDLNLKRIKRSNPGGTWRDWPKSLRSNCHKLKSGATFPSVYGRMAWDEPSPTITTQFFGFGNGRFGHPEQDRAISLREGALLQSFPKNYRFCDKGSQLSFQKMGQLIGNAVPVRLGRAIGLAIRKHLKRIETNRG